MSKETKFGYGFLLAGFGMPYLMFEIFGVTAAVITASFCTVIGIALLIAGHRHKEQRTKRGIMATVGFYTLVGLLVGASTGAIAGIALALKQKFHPEVATENKPAENKPLPTPEAAATESRPSAAPEVHAKIVLSPYTRTESFTIDVPYYAGDDGFPLVLVEDYPLNEVYTCMTSPLILYAPVVPGAAIKQIPSLDTNDKRAEALTEILRYCLVEDIHQSERGSTKFGMDVKKGPISDYRPAIMPPHATDYPPEKFKALIGTLPFGKNQRIQMLYGRALRVPQGSDVKFTVEKIDSNDYLKHWVFRIEKHGVFNLSFGVAPINSVGGLLPQGYPDQLKAQQSKYTTYSFAITMKVEIQRTSTNASDVEDFVRWSDGLWAAIRDRYDIKLLK